MEEFVTLYYGNFAILGEQVQKIHPDAPVVPTAVTDRTLSGVRYFLMN